jgi:RimJ/RimL family protein N-acetyltransferase
MLILETPRLNLKPHTLDNAEKLNAWENDPELLHYNDDQPPDRQSESLDETRQYLESLAHDGQESRILHFAIHLKPDQELIGMGMVGFIDRYNRSCRLGVTIGEKRYWGMGFAKEALQAVIAFCFETLQMNRIGAEVYAFNQRSIRLFEGLGFRREGIVRQAVLKQGAFYDEYLYGLLRCEWQGRRLS